MPARILVVEDNPANLDLMAYLLRAFGHTALTATSGPDGWDSVHRELPDLVVCDVQLPGYDGCELVKRLKADPAVQQIPVVAVTAQAMVGDRERLLAEGFDGYLAKPILAETFVQQLDEFLPPDRRARSVATASPETAGEATVQGRRATILAVDDLPVNLALIQSTFEPFGYTVLTARDVEEALLLARMRKPDLVLSDLHMPRQDGFALLHALRAEAALSTIPFVFIASTTLSSDQRERALREGAIKFILRPIEPTELLAEIESCLQRGRSG
jgi:two-component system cell cycle response regulator